MDGKKRYSAAVVGLGSGGGLSLNALESSDRFDPVAICDVSPTALESAGARFPQAARFTDPLALFAACPTDLVCVSTWSPSHKEIALAALELPLAGILVEKPIGDTTGAAREIVDAVRRKGIPLCVPHGLRAAPHTLEILRRVRDGEIGDLLLVEVQCDRWDIINAGIHWLDFFVALSGGDPVEQVAAQCDRSTRTYRDGMQVETWAVTYAVTRGGVRFVMNTGDSVTTSARGKSTVYRIVGSGGTIEFWGWESAYLIVNAAHPAGSLIHVRRGAETNHQLHLEALAARMDAGAPEYAAAEESLAALEIVEAAYLSSRHGCRVDLPLSGFTPPGAIAWVPGAPYAGEGGGRDGRRLP